LSRLVLYDHQIKIEEFLNEDQLLYQEKSNNHSILIQHLFFCNCSFGELDLWILMEITAYNLMEHEMGMNSIYFTAQGRPSIFQLQTTLITDWNRNGTGIGVGRPWNVDSLSQ